MFGGYLYDIGNAIHRVNHEKNSVILTVSPLERLLNRLYHGDTELAFREKCEVLHTLFSSDDNVPCLSVKAGVVTIADGTDMAEGRNQIFISHVRRISIQYPLKLLNALK